MDVAAIRLANLKHLIDLLEKQPPAGRLRKDIAVDLDLSGSFLSQLVGGKKMGDDVARKIEQARRLPHGWMDQPQWPDGTHVQDADALPYGASHPLRIDPDTIAAAIKLVRLSFLNLGLEIDQEENGTPLVAAYEFLLARQERTVTAENLVAFKPRLEQRLKEKADDAIRSRELANAGRSDRQHGQGREAS